MTRHIVRTILAVVLLLSFHSDSRGDIVVEFAGTAEAISILWSDGSFETQNDSEFLFTFVVPAGTLDNDFSSGSGLFPGTLTLTVDDLNISHEVSAEAEYGLTTFRGDTGSGEIERLGFVPQIGFAGFLSATWDPSVGIIGDPDDLSTLASGAFPSPTSFEIDNGFHGGFFLPDGTGAFHSVSFIGAISSPSISAVPEPSSLAMLCLLGAGAITRRSRRKDNAANINSNHCSKNSNAVSF